MIVGQGHIFDKYLAYDSYPGLAHGLVYREAVESLDYALTHVFVAVFAAFIYQRIDTDILPVFVQRVGGAGRLFIRTHMIQAAHEQVPVYERVRRVQQQAGRQLEP